MALFTDLGSPTFVDSEAATQAAVFPTATTPPTLAQSNVPIQVAHLAALDVIIELLAMQMGASAPDVRALMADAIWNRTLGEGQI
jgi:hypothetical protein